jgi:hypothetical protein
LTRARTTTTNQQFFREVINQYCYINEQKIITKMGLKKKSFQGEDRSRTGPRDKQYLPSEKEKNFTLSHI